MTTLAFVLASLLDPIQAGIVFGALRLWRRGRPLIVSAAVAVVISETIIALATSSYSWGELIIPRFIAALVQAAIIFWLLEIARRMETDLSSNQADALQRK